MAVTAEERASVPGTENRVAADAGNTFIRQLIAQFLTKEAA